jgi:diguanylate cyclase (GGDEF)-like protein
MRIVVPARLIRLRWRARGKFRGVRWRRRDPLTGLGNRRVFAKALGRQLQGGAGALVVLDLDYFGHVNMVRGHDEGDHVLVRVSDRLRASAPKQSVYRIGGNEFALLVPDVGLATAVELAEHARTAIEDELAHLTLIVYPNKQVTPTATCGVVAWVGGERRGFEAVWAAADELLSAGKIEGRNQVVSAVIDWHAGRAE